MNDNDLNNAIETAIQLWARTGSKTELGIKARDHLTGLLDEQMRRALAKPGTPDSSTE